MATKEELRAQLRALQVEIEQDRASFEQRLIFAHAIIVGLREDREWLRGVADARAERIAALEAQLLAAELQIEALRQSGKSGKKRLARIVVGLLAATASVAELSGWSVRDLVERPNEPMAALVATIEPSDRVTLGLVDVPSDRDTLLPEASSVLPEVSSVVHARSRTFLLGLVEISNTTDRDVSVTVRAGPLGAAAVAVPPSRGARTSLVVLEGHEGIVTVRNYSLSTVSIKLEWK